MLLTISGKEYEIKFGIRFLRELDKKYFVESNNVKYGQGLELKVPQILTGDILTLAEFLYLGMCTEKSKPTQAQIDEFLDETEDIEALFDEVTEELKKQNATKLKMRELVKYLKAVEQDVEKAIEEAKL